MRFCPFCGKEINSSAKFCSYCSKKLNESKELKTQSKTTTKSHLVLSIVLFLVFAIIIAIVIIAFKQKGNETNTANLALTLSEERLLDISQQIKEIKAFEEKRKEGYSLDEKPFAEGDYSFEERTVDFRLVCKNPCPISKAIFDQEFAAISYAISTVRGLTKSDIDKSLLPFEVHASEDSVCQKLQGAAAYMTKFTDKNGYTRGLLCFFYDKIEYNRDKFPYSTSVHEVMHLFEHNKVPYKRQEGGSVLWEGLSEMMESFFLKGNERNSFCWKGNAWYKDVLKYSEDAHWVGGDLFFELCNKYSFDYDDLPELFRQLEIRGENVDEKEFVKIMNNIVGADTSALFKKAGVIK